MTQYINEYNMKLIVYNIYLIVVNSKIFVKRCKAAASVSWIYDFIFLQISAICLNIDKVFYLTLDKIFA
ncbi:MAG TPA: hypothetical protein DC034_05905 [Clostridium sp.]|nr:hypothetical protein [Clostridium sp.]